MDIFENINLKGAKYTINRKKTDRLTDENLDLSEETKSQSGFLGLSVPKSRLTGLTVFMLLMICILLAKTAHLQVIRGSYYFHLSEGNRIRIQNIIPKRGIIFDRNGKQLVRNIPNFSIAIVPLDLPRDTVKKAEVFAEVSKIVDIPLYEIQSKIAKFATLYPHPIVIKENLNYDSAVMLNIKSISLPGVVFQTNYNREYLTVNNDGSVQPNTQNNSTAHILGYIGTITEEEFKNINTDNYLLDDKIGKTGIEYSYEDILRGTMGQKQVEVDALGKEKKTIAQDDQIPGKNIFLTIDSESQLKLERVLRELMAERKKERASAIAMDPNDGSIIAMVSLPSFNNNDFSGGISQKAYQALLENPNRPLFNRSVAGTYPSGSTIKPIIATAALNEGIITPNTTVYSTGGIRINQWFFPDWKAGGHGPTNLRSSLAWSVNTYYYYIGGGYEGFEGLGVQRLGAYMSEFQLGKKLGIDVPSEAAGFIPSKEWKEQTKNESWYIGDTYHMAIGQGDLLVTPLQVATWTSFFANKGTVYKPHFLFATAEEGYEPQYAETAVLNSNFVPENHVEQVRQGLRDTVVWGSAQRLNTLKVPAAGKTGTAQWHSDPERDPHSWFTAFAPFDDPEVVITVLVEEGGEGSDLALEVSKRFLMWYFEGIHARENDDTLPAENATITADTQAEYP